MSRIGSRHGSAASRSSAAPSRHGSASSKSGEAMAPRISSAATRALGSARTIGGRIVIIGAGIAGLAAASKLLEYGVNDLIIIEAQNRIGGRINTIPFQDKHIEIGAQWMHGTEKNPVYELGSNLGLVDESPDDADEMLYATQDGKLIEPEIVEKIQGKVEEYKDNLSDKLSSELNENNDKGLGDYFDEYFNEIVEEFGSNADIELIKAIYSAGTNNERFESSCDDLHQLSAFGWNQYESLEGNQFTKLKYGYSKIIDFLAAQLPQSSIKLNEMVEKIDWSNDMVKVTTYNNTEKKRIRYEAKVVLSTIPLGCLKRNANDLFMPQLPQEKMVAIQRLGFGTVNKVFVAFDSAFDDKFQGVQIIWKKGLNFDFNNMIKKWNLKDNGFQKALNNFDRLPQFNNVLIGFVAGEHANYIETLSDECLLDILIDLFKKCFPNSNLKPKQVVRSRWESNVFSRGAYSFIKLGSTPDDMKALSEPIDNKIFFGGESTISEYAGTVHGAFISGQRAAEQIKDFV